MMVTFISQCEKKALAKTRRVLDAFADRIGDNTWQTIITEEGLIAVKKLLRQTATKNTAVACHWMRSRSRSELVWVVGNRRKFNSEGIVPVNSTEIELEPYLDQHAWQPIKDIQYAAAIAALFHDFGKANNLFQNKLDPAKKGEFSEPYRHEWVSMRLFQAFVGDRTDDAWLKALCHIERDTPFSCYRDGLDGDVSKNHPLQQLPPFAQLVAWLIVSHHKLPVHPYSRNDAPSIDEAGQWLGVYLTADWNSSSCDDPERGLRLQENWTFDKGLPSQSNLWRSSACLLASDVLAHRQQTQGNYLHEQLFTTHMARLCLMMADHHYSSLTKVTNEWRSEHYEAFANTDRGTGQLKQKLDEHHIGVAYHAQKIAKQLPYFNRSLPQLERNSALEARVEQDKKASFGWQDDARQLVKKISVDTKMQGFFAINMASTGKGKTQANAKIMYALGQGAGRVRFNIALGLRTLTLQTGVEYRDKLQLDEDELALLVGGQSVKQLFENEQKKLGNKSHSNEQETGSASQELLLGENVDVHSKVKIETHSLSDWTSHDPRMEQLLQAPVLVCTIDHLISATEGTRGGKHIAPMLRLLSSDLVLDEPDDFGLEDLPALCRLVHWAGMLGSRVLLSTATMPPALAYALFEAYHAGWAQYAKAHLALWDKHIVCAWFDEFEHVEHRCDNLGLYQTKHNAFTKQRVEHLKSSSLALRKGYIAPIATIHPDALTNFAHTIYQNIIALHQKHHVSQEGKHISIGLVRMANINPLIAVAKKLLNMDASSGLANCQIHFCVYHSRYPLAIRSHIENKLDRLLKRHQPEALWVQPEISQAIAAYPQMTHHIFVVLASPVAEVGRDHDYDWAVVEPSSMRSIIQLAGRILRHRPQEPKEPNICLLNQNYRALGQQPVCFAKPGFESKELQFAKHTLKDLIPPEQYEVINAISKIVLPEDKNNVEHSFIGLEHKAVASQLFGDKKKGKLGGASVWWKNQPHWCGEVQRQQRFRASQKDEAYYLILKCQYSDITWQWKNENVYPARFCEPLIEIRSDTVKVVEGHCFWFNLDAQNVYAALERDFGIELSEVGRRFGELRLADYSNGEAQVFNYHPNFGVYQEV